MSYKTGIWATQILGQQNEYGSWGIFHSMAVPIKGRPLTTEQALRRLKILGFSKEDEVIRKALSFMHDCLSGEKSIPDQDALNEVYNNLMLSAWIRQFTDDDACANPIADIWSGIIAYACGDASFDEAKYQKAYEMNFGRVKRPGLSVNFNKLYPVVLAANRLPHDKEVRYFEKLLSYPQGIYYMGYDKPLNIPPQNFKSKEASRYLGSIEVLLHYRNPACKERLHFVADWLNENRDADGLWDMGPAVNDQLYFPLSDSWRNIENRKADCSYRIRNIMNAIGT